MRRAFVLFRVHLEGVRWGSDHVVGALPLWYVCVFDSVFLKGVRVVVVVSVSVCVRERKR